MDSGYRQRTRPTATAVAVPEQDLTVPPQRTSPQIESSAPGDTPPGDSAPAGTAPGTTVTPPVQAPVTQPCRCGHDRDAHEHFRRGTDCAACGCARFRTPGLLARLRG